MKLEKAQMLANDTLVAYLKEQGQDRIPNAAMPYAALTVKMAEAFAHVTVDEPREDGPYLFLCRKLVKTLRALCTEIDSGNIEAITKAAREADDVLTLHSVSQCVDLFEQWQLVPKVPTPEMSDSPTHGGGLAKEDYEALLRAAPKPPGFE